MKKNPLLLAVAILAIAASPAILLADSTNVSFETPTYNLGTINGQDGWVSLGSSGSGCALYDHAVATNTSGFALFGAQSLRISNAVTSGCFGDQTFAKPLVNAAGEADSTNGSFAAGTLQSHFEMELDVASATSTQQPGLFVSISPDRGDGSRMSYLGLSDELGGVRITFYDVQGTGNPASFVPTDLGVFSRAVPHHLKLSIDFVDGPSNDIVKVWIDGVLVHTGTTWENYYRYDSEASAEQSPRIIKSVIFRTGGPAAPSTLGSGYFFDNLTLMSGQTPVPPPTVPTDKDQCKKGGWKDFSSSSFKNQGQCVSYVVSKNPNK